MNTRVLCAALGGIASAFFLSTLRANPPLASDPQVIQGCEIDVRPITRPEAQIYYEALPNSSLTLPAGTYKTVFRIYVMMGDVLEVSSWDATLPAVLLKSGGANVVELSFDTNQSPIQPKIKVVLPDRSLGLDETTQSWGSFDPLGSFQDPPTVESVRRNDPDDEKGRIRITSVHHGVSMAFTLSDV